MTWLKLSDDFAEQCADAELSDAAFRTHVEGLLWAMRRESEGRLRGRDLRRFPESSDADKAVDQLVAVGFWIPSGDGCQIVHHMEHQPDREVMERRRVIAANRQRRYRRRRAGLDVEPVIDDGPTALYRWYDEADILLYIGITNGLMNRQTAHAQGSSWADFAARSTVERFSTRVDAEDAEEVAVKAEKPLFNDTHNDTDEARERLVAYLVEKSRTDLLVPSVSRA